MSNYNMSVTSLMASAEGKGNLEKLSDGVYNAIVIGYSVVKQEFKDEKTGLPKESVGAKLIMQVMDDEGKPAIISTTSLKASLHEKAGLRKILSSWMKKNDLQGIVDELIKAGIVVDDTFSWAGFIGRTPGIMVSMTPSKKDSTKIYPEIKSVIPTKGAPMVAVPMEISEFFVRDTLEYKLMDGFTLRKPKQNHMENVTAQVGFGGPVVSDEDLPF